MNFFSVKKQLKRFISIATVMCTPFFADAAEKLPAEFQGVTIRERLGTQIDLESTFTNINGQNVKIGDFLKDGKPLLLTLNYYDCKTLCSLQLNAVVDGLRGLNWPIGERFKAVTISIDPKNTSEMAKEKRSLYLNALGQPNADWTFLTGQEDEIRKIASDVGFEYKYIEEEKEYSHGLGIFFISPEGKVSRYLYGLTYKPLDLRLALLDASDGKTATALDKFVMNCFQYNSKDGQYSAAVFNIMRFGGLLAVSILGSSMAIMWRNEKKRHREESATCS